MTNPPRALLKRSDTFDGHVALQRGGSLYSALNTERSVRPLALTILGVMTAAACTGSGYEPQAEGDAPARATGMLFVERVEGGGSPGVQVGARFLRMVGVSDEALPDLVGTPVVPPAGRCIERGTAGDAAPDPLRAEVRLLDVGTIRVQAEGAQLSMDPRRFPDLWNVVSGVLYGAEADLPLGTWRFTAQGAQGLGIGAFDVSAQAPETLAQVRVGEASLPTTGNLALTLARRGVLPIRWLRTVSDDRISVVFEGNGMMACGARDEGSLDLDGAMADRAREIIGTGGTISVHRMRSRPFSTQGLDAATLVFDLSVRARARIE